MPVNRQQILQGADIVLRVGVLGVGPSGSLPIAATAVVGVGGNLVSELVSRGLRHSCTRIGQGHEVFNGDLQRALEQAYRRAIGFLKDLRWKTPRGTQIRRTEPVRKAECNGAFELLRSSANGLMSATYL